jgi:hypothetical protein
MPELPSCAIAAVLARSGRQTDHITISADATAAVVNCPDEIEFSFLNRNLVVPGSGQPISLMQPDAAHL